MKKLIKTITIVLVLGFLANPGFFALGQNTDDSGSLNTDAALKINQEIKNINSDINDKKNNIQNIQKKQAEYSDAIKQKQGEKASLNNQLAILDNRLAKSGLDIDLVETEIDRVGLEKQKTDIEIAEKDKQIANSEQDIANVLNLLHKKDNVNTLEIMLLNDSFADFLSDVKYLEDVNQTIGDSLKQLKTLKSDQEKTRAELDKQNQELDALKIELTEKQKDLQSQQDTKVVILSQVNQSERQYQRLLAQAKKEQEDAAAEIARLEKTVRAKLAQLDSGDLQYNDNGMVWPVPKNTITAYFHDPDYPFRYIFEHPAIDIRAAQGTPIKAAASGYVARASNGGMGYSYIMLIHGDGLSTVYGHVSKILVNDDDYVVQGQTIGLSGGMPGTPGAGGLTTGSHLHFEVRLNGIPVDPLGYLP